MFYEARQRRASAALLPPGYARYAEAHVLSAPAAAPYATASSFRLLRRHKYDVHACRVCPDVKHARYCSRRLSVFSEWLRRWRQHTKKARMRSRGERRCCKSVAQAFIG